MRILCWLGIHTQVRLRDRRPGDDPYVVSGQCITCFKSGEYDIVNRVLTPYPKEKERRS